MCFVARLAGVFILLLGIEAGARAGALSDAAVNQLIDEGLVAFRAAQWDRARVLLKRAFEARPRTSLAYNLAITEAKTGNWVDAARHLDYCDRYAPELTARDRELAVAVRGHVAVLDIEVDVDGVPVSVDEEVIGESPLVTSVFVTPGMHAVQAVKPDAGQDRQSVDVAAGSRSAVKLRLHAAEGASAGGTVGGTRAIGSTPGTVRQPVISGPDCPMPRSFFYEPRNIALLAGTGLTVGAVGFAVASIMSGSEQQDRVDGIVDRMAQISGLGACRELPGSVVCASLRDANDERDREYRRAYWALATGGIVAAATAGVYLFWKPRASESRMVVPVRLEHGAGVAVTGDF